MEVHMNKKCIVVITIICIIILAVLFVEIYTLKNQKQETKGNSINAFIINEVNSFNNDIINEPEENLNINRSIEKVNIEVLSETITNETAEILITDKNETPFYWVEDFKIQKKVNGEWETLKFKSDNLFFNTIVNHLDINNQIRMKIDYGFYYGTLEKGIYRIAKLAIGNDEIYFYTDEFEIK